MLTSASLMARGAATDEAIEIARATPTLGVGCHVVLVDGEPVLSPSEIPTFVNRSTGCFHSSLTSFLMRLFTGRIRSAEIEAEAAAQIALLQARGLHLTHIDTHKHAHMFPAVLRPVLRAARAAGIRAVRNPFEPAWAMRATAGASWARCAQVSVLRRLQPACRQIIAEEGFATTDGTIAVVGTGILNAATLRFLLKATSCRAPGNWSRIPATTMPISQKVRTRLRASRDIERDALRIVKEYPAIELVSYARLTAD